MTRASTASSAFPEITCYTITKQRILDKRKDVNVLLAVSISTIARAPSAPISFPEITCYMQLYADKEYQTSSKMSTLCWLSAFLQWHVHHQTQSHQLQVLVISNYIAKHTAHTQRCQCLVICQCFCNGTCSFNTEPRICNYISLTYYIIKHTIHMQRCQCFIRFQYFCNGKCASLLHWIICNHM